MEGTRFDASWNCGVELPPSFKVHLIVIPCKQSRREFRNSNSRVPAVKLSLSEYRLVSIQSAPTLPESCRYVAQHYPSDDR